MKRLIFLLTTTIASPAMAQIVLFDDFSNHPTRDWEFITDQVMGGVSSGKLEYLSETGSYFARMTGTVSFENNGGFIQLRRKVLNRFDKSK